MSSQVFKEVILKSEMAHLNRRPVEIYLHGAFAIFGGAMCVVNYGITWSAYLFFGIAMAYFHFGLQFAQNKKRHQLVVWMTILYAAHTTVELVTGLYPVFHFKLGSKNPAFAFFMNHLHLAYILFRISWVVYFFGIIMKLRKIDRLQKELAA